MSSGNIQYVAADATGRIIYSGNIPAFMFDAQTPPEGGVFVTGTADSDAQYVVEGEIVERPANPATIDGLTLKNLPVPCTLIIEGVEHACADETAELSFSHPGTYPVKVATWPARDVTFEVTQA